MFFIRKLIFSFLLLLMAMVGISQTTPLTVKFAFKGIVDGYDHQCKTQVWSGDELLGESPVVNESQGGTFTLNVPIGTYSLRVINLALYEETWEEHTLENDYSLDCFWEGEHTFTKKPEKLFLLFDIDDAMSMSWKKMPK